MRINTLWKGPRSLAALLCVALAMPAFLAACGDDEDSGGSGGAAPSAAEEQAAANASKCGLGNGEKASGDPITLGAIITKQPGTDFTDISDMAKAYFDCVNDNGGINGRPVEYKVETEQTNPQQVSSLATKLIENDKVLGIVGNTSLIDCAVNQKYYAKQGYNVIANGVARECYFSENIRDINMGPYYSTVGAGQYLINQGAKSLVAATLKAPGTDFNNQGAVELAKENNIPGKSITEVVPINDGAALALKLVEAAGEGGGVILDFIPPEALKVLQGAEQQGLIDKVKWACATPCNDASIAEALGPAWNDKLGINAELNLVDSKGPDNQLFLQVQKKYAPDAAVGSFGQMGFTDALIATKALLTVKGDFTKESVNEAFKNIKDLKTDILCNPWTFGEGVRLANDADRTIVPKDHKFVEKEKCFDIAALPSNNLAEQRGDSGGN
ncbi:MAG: branched-chain amino acid transport system substrate-binding protein [Solirubrobacteraceae bacterium]|nr:branched-chain amino acid transport system substrate-binding protein [Solirubrobacteraceae bacterium]